MDLAEEGVDEEGDTSALKGTVLAVGRRKEVRRMGVGQELGNNGRLRDDVLTVGDRGDKAALQGGLYISMGMLGMFAGVDIVAVHIPG